MLNPFGCLRILLWIWQTPPVFVLLPPFITSLIIFSCLFLTWPHQVNWIRCLPLFFFQFVPCAPFIPAFSCFFSVRVLLLLFPGLCPFHFTCLPYSSFSTNYDSGVSVNIVILMQRRGLVWRCTQVCCLCCCWWRQQRLKATHTLIVNPFKKRLCACADSALRHTKQRVTLRCIKAVSSHRCEGHSTSVSNSPACPPLTWTRWTG